MRPSPLLDPDRYGVSLGARREADHVDPGAHVRTVVSGDRVLFDPDERSEVELHGRDYILLRERDVHAVAAERIEESTGLYL